jgi:uncharacterized protein YbaP (TraB family)
LLQSTAARQDGLANFQATFDAATARLARDSDKTAAASSAARGQASAMTSAEYLADYLRKGPAQHMREAILKEMGLSEADLAAMPPGQRAAVENAITEKIRELMEAQNDKARGHAAIVPRRI